MEELNAEVESEELDMSKDTGSADAFAKILLPASSLETFDNKKEKSNGIKFDPSFAKSGLLLNKDLILKIKDLKSNLGLKPKVLFLERFKNSAKSISTYSTRKDDREHLSHHESV